MNEPLRDLRVLALNASDELLAECEKAASALGAEVVGGSIASAAALIATHDPCAVVVSEDVYAFDRSGLSRLAIENGAPLVVWSEEIDRALIAPLVEAAISRRRARSGAAPEKGAVLEGRYELLRDLGGHGSRWEVRHARTGRRSILEVGSRSEAESENAARVGRIASALARITHPGAVDLRDAGTTELGEPFVVLEMLEGRTLEGLIAARGRLSSEDACALVLALADLLAAAHAAGVAHGDVRTENVVVVRDGYGEERVKLTGWGSAVVFDADTASSDGPGAVARDVRALGACAFEAIVGRPPRRDESAPVDVPDALARAIARALSVDTFTTTIELASALESAVPRAREPISVLGDARRDAGGDAAPAAAGPEQRRSARAPYRTPVRVEVPGLGAVDGRSEDISSRGLLLVARRPIEPGTEVTLRFALPLDGKVVAELAVVRWSRASGAGDAVALTAMGVELTAPAPESLRQIERYVSFMGT